MNRRPSSLLGLAFAVSLAACSNGTQFSAPTTPAMNAGGDAVAGTAVVKITIVAPKPALRRAHYFSPSSRGLLVDAYVHGTHKLVAHAVANIAKGSKACGGSKTDPRTCSITLSVPANRAVDFTIGDYDARPKGATIPKTAHLLGYGRLVNKKLSTAKTNGYRAFLGGVVSGLSGNPAYVSLPGDGTGHDVALVIDPVDFGNNPITAGGKDPFANPIVVTVTESGGTGHAMLSLDGGAPATSVTLLRSSDTVEVLYDGLGSIGYTFTVRLASLPVAKSSGASESIVVAPLLLASASTNYAAPVLAMTGNGDYETMTVGEAGAPAGTIFTAIPSNCNAIASMMPVAQASSSSATFAVIARGTIAAASATGCIITVSDGTTTVVAQLSNTYSGVEGTPTIVEAAIPNPSASPNVIAVGPDGNLWFTQCSTYQIGKVSPVGGTFTLSQVPLPAPAGTASPKPTGVTAGPDGNLWFNSYTGADLIGKMAPAGGGATYPVTTGAGVEYMAAGPNGTLWFSECYGNQMGRVSTDGTVAYLSTNLSHGGNAEIALGADGNMWFAEYTNGKIGKIDTTTGTITEYPLPSSTSKPWGITAGPDGALWFAECYGGTGNGAIGRIPTNATTLSPGITEYSTGITGHQPTSITTGPDGALWFTYFDKGTSGFLNGKNGLGRIDPTSHLITEFSVATANADNWGITAGPDGAIWFVENGRDGGGGKIGRVKLQTSSALRYRRR